MDENRFERASWGPISAFMGTVLAFLIPQVIIAFVAVNFDESVLTVIGGLPWLSLALQLGVSLATVLFSFGFVYGSGSELKVIGFKLGNYVDLLKKLFAVFFIYLGVSLSISMILAQILPEEIIDQAQELGFSETLSGINLIPVGLALIVVAPITEEILFRGFLFKGLRKKLSFVPAAFISGALFALAHYQINVGIDVFIMSIGLAWLYENTGSIWAPILMHMLKNALAFVLVFIVVV